MEYDKNHLNHNIDVSKIHASNCKHLCKYVPGTLLPLMFHLCLKTFWFLKKQLPWCQAEEIQPSSGSPALRFVATRLPRPAETRPLLNLSKPVFTLSLEQQHCEKEGDIYGWPHTCWRVLWKQWPAKAKAINILLTHHSGIYLSQALQQSDQQQLSKAGPVPGPFLSWHFSVKNWDKELRKYLFCNQMMQFLYAFRQHLPLDSDALCPWFSDLL